MAWRDPRVRALSQFLMYDSPPDTQFQPGSLGYWSTFQTGLAYQNGALKPSYAAYRVPVFVPDQTVDAGRAGAGLGDAAACCARQLAAGGCAMAGVGRRIVQDARHRWRSEPDRRARGEGRPAGVRGAEGGVAGPGGAVYYSRGVAVRVR